MDSPLLASLAQAVVMQKTAASKKNRSFILFMKIFYIPVERGSNTLFL
ncbi:MAG: hypothetical protein IJ717_10030 [Treponema sp.]|nr:hypothetical protein [Treponema sp.]